MRDQVANRSSSGLITEELRQAWQRVCGRLLREVGTTTYERCFKTLRLKGYGNDRVVLAMSTGFARAFVQSNFADLISRCWQAERPDIVAVDIVVAALAPEDVLSAAELSDGSPVPLANGAHAQASPTKANGEAVLRDGVAQASPRVNGASLRSDLDGRYSFDNFVVGQPNALAYQASRRISDDPLSPYNPLYLYGASGLGKTHLLYAIGNAIAAGPSERRVRYVSAETFLNDFVAALRSKDTLAFKAAFRSVDVLLVDDIHFIANKESIQEELFHTLNTLHAQNKQIVVTATCAPNALDGIQDRIRSRLGSGFAVDIQQTDYPLRLDILRAKARAFQDWQAARQMTVVAVCEDVLAFIAERVTANVRDLQGALNDVMANAELTGQPMTIDLARQVLRDRLRSKERPLTIDDIMQVTAQRFELSVKDLKSECRAQAVVRARHIAMWLARELTQRSYPQIGQRFGDRDHTSVIHGVKKITGLRQRDPELAADLQGLLDLLKR